MMIKTTRLILRPLLPSDVSKAYVDWLNDPEVTRFLETRHFEQNDESVRKFVAEKAASDNEFLFGIFLTKDERHIGNIKVGPVSNIHRLADVSLFIGACECWGKGYAAEAISAVSRHAFETLGICKLSASMYASNEGSRRAFLKVGYVEEGKRRHHYMLDGLRCDLVELGLLPSDLTG